MLTIVCGEDSVASRGHVSVLAASYREKGYDVTLIEPPQVKDILSWLADSPGLFVSKRIYLTERLEKTLPRKSKKKATVPSADPYAVLEEIAGNKEIILVDWEPDKAGRELKLIKMATVKEFKPDTNVFKLCESCYPGNKDNFISSLGKLVETNDGMFVYLMLARHIRMLLLAQENKLPASVAWQKYKLSAQASRWKQDKLVSFYEGLYRLDLSVKTGTNPYGAAHSLDILACHYL